ncbi:MAG: LysM peptidoglycan-binding domain-containing protein [Actinobacteria bacterium]|nr:MAG: LysM peptidoglycan-binding domain-containing protein [Actinomycetota bacterium]
MTAYQPITVRQPALYDIVDDPVAVSGVGTGFEGTFAARVRDAQGHQLGQVTIHAGGSGIWGNFQVGIALSGVPGTPQGMLEVYEVSAAGAGEVNKVTVLVTFGRALLNPYHGFLEHTVAQGETLSAIAGRYYGNVNLWPRVFEANRHILLDANRIFIGQVLRIPQ